MCVARFLKTRGIHSVRSPAVLATDKRMYRWFRIVFAAPIYYGTGAISVLGVLACTLIRDMPVRLLCVGLTMAVVLWITSVLMLWRMRQG